MLQTPPQIDPRILMQMMLAKSAAPPVPGAAPGGDSNTANQPQPGIPGAAPTVPQGTPQPQSQGQSQGQSSGQPAPQLSPAKPTPFTGTFGDRKGIISQIVNSAEQRSHDKKVNEAEMYYNQINSFLASGKPEDAQRAHQLLDDPKVRKILKAGLDYVPLEEAPPPEAIGINKAQQKIQQKQSAMDQVKKLILGGRQQGSAQQAPPRPAIIPGASQAAQQAYSLGEAKTQEQKSLADMHQAEAQADAVKAAAEKQKADAETMKAEAERARSRDQAAEFRSHARLYDKQAKEYGATNPAKSKEMTAHANEMTALGRYYDAMAKYTASGKTLPASALQAQIKSARGDMVALLKGYISDNKDAARAVSKDTGYLFGPRSGLVQQQQDAAKQAKAMSAAVAWFDGEGTTAVTKGKMTLPEAVRHAYEIAGIEAPLPGMAGSDDEPERPQGVPEDAEWDPETRTWSVPEEQ